MVDDIPAVSGQQRLVEPHGHGTDGRDPIVGQHPPVAAVAENVHFVVFADTHRDQAFGHLADLGVKLVPAYRFGPIVGDKPPVGVMVLPSIHRFPEHFVDVSKIPELFHSPSPVGFVSGHAERGPVSRNRWCISQFPPLFNRHRPRPKGNRIGLIRKWVIRKAQVGRFDLFIGVGVGIGIGIDKTGM